MVLDSNVDPRKVWYQANLDQDPAFERNTKIWFAWVAKYDSVYHLGKTEKAVENLWYQTQNELQANPAGGIVGADEFSDAFELRGRTTSRPGSQLGDTFASWVHGKDTAKLVDLYEEVDGPGDDNGFAMYLATECTDAHWPSSIYEGLRRQLAGLPDGALPHLEQRLVQRALLVLARSGQHAGEDQRQPGRADPARSTRRSTLRRRTKAASRPGASSRRSSLIALPGGTSHANSLNGDACLDNQIAAYLANGTLPHRKAGNRADATCQPLPVPVPTAASMAPQAKARTAAPDLPALRNRLVQLVRS